MADGEHYRSVISSRTSVTETILHETAKRHGAAAMGILPLGTAWCMSYPMTMDAKQGNWSWRAAFDSDCGHKV
jgi:hypothetical protein